MNKINRILSIVTVLSLVLGLVGVNTANAAVITSLSDVMDLQAVNDSANHTISFALSSSGALSDTDSVTVTFPGDFVLTGVTEDDLDIAGSSNTVITTAADCSSTEEMSAVVSGQAITFTFCAGDGGGFANSEVVTIEIGTNATDSGTGVNQIENPASSGNKIITIDSSVDDPSQIAVYINALNANEVLVSATVDPSISLTLSSGTCALTPNLTVSSTATCTYTVGTATNATSGLTAYASAPTATLVSGGNDIDACAGTNCDNTGTGGNTSGIDAGFEEYGFYISSLNSTNGTGSDHVASGSFSTEAQAVPTVASTTPIFTTTSAHATTASTITHAAAVSGITPAGAYSQTITWTVVGNF